MNLNDLLTWSIIVDVCALALLAQTAWLLRTLFVTRQACWRYLFVTIPLITSFCCFSVAVDALQVYTRFVDNMPAHGGPMLWFYIEVSIQGALSSCQLAASIAVAVFALMLFLARKTLPRHVPAPTWVVARERMLYR